MSTSLSELAYDKAAEMAAAADAMLSRITHSVEIAESTGESAAPWRALIIETIELRHAIHCYRFKLSKKWAEAAEALGYDEVPEYESVNE